MDALIVASTQKTQHALCDVLHGAGALCVVCNTAAEARRAMLYRPFDIFVISGGLTDERGNTLAADMAEESDVGGVYIDDSMRADVFCDELAKLGVVTLSRPITRQTLLDSVRLVLAANARVRALKAKNEELSAKLEDLKYISRAKIVLMRSLGYSEEQAHKYIEKKSMDLRVSRKKVAMDILKTYEAY